jgi:hypothetical protein
MVERCTVEGTGVGALRTVELRGGMTILERCERHDRARRMLTYSIVGKSPTPIRDYVSTCHVVETGPDRCRVHWRGRFEPEGAPEEQAAAMVRGIYTTGIATVRRLLEK